MSAALTTMAPSSATTTFRSVSPQPVALSSRAVQAHDDQAAVVAIATSGTAQPREVCSIVAVEGVPPEVAKSSELITNEAPYAHTLAAATAFKRDEASPPEFPSKLAHSPKLSHDSSSLPCIDSSLATTQPERGAPVASAIEHDASSDASMACIEHSSCAVTSMHAVDAAAPGALATAPTRSGPEVADVSTGNDHSRDNRRSSQESRTPAEGCSTSRSISNKATRSPREKGGGGGYKQSEWPCSKRQGHPSHPTEWELLQEGAMERLRHDLQTQATTLGALKMLVEKQMRSQHEVATVLQSQARVITREVCKWAKGFVELKLKEILGDVPALRDAPKCTERFAVGPIRDRTARAE